MDLTAQVRGLAHQRLQRLPTPFLTHRGSPLPFVNTGDKTIGVPPFHPLENHRVGRGFKCLDPRLVHPAKIEAVGVAIADFEPQAILPFLPRDLLAVDHGAHHPATVFEAQHGQILRPEHAGAIVKDDPHQPGDHRQAQRQRAARKPYEGVAPAPEFHHSRLYLSLRRCRTTSATELMQKVAINSNKPLRNNTR